jgi:hypothetical protein
MSTAFFIPFVFLRQRKRTFRKETCLSWKYLNGWRGLMKNESPRPPGM